MNFYNKLIRWYLQNARDLPWRQTKDPYLIWLSEIILQQTRVAQGLPYFHAFSSAFPSVFDLAKAEEEQVLKLWQGLGYYSRARNLHQTAQKVAFELNGVFPDTYVDLLKLKGIGAYTAAALASFCYDEAVAVVDGNVFRLLARYFDIETDISQASARDEFSALAQSLMPKEQPALFNQAIMEFGALQCVPVKPNCGQCVFNDSCAALQKNKVATLPIKLKKIKVKKRYLNYIIAFDSMAKTFIQKRTHKGIWHNLYEFPLLETEQAVEPGRLALQIVQQFFQEYPVEDVVELHQEMIVHKLSHQQLYIKFWQLQLQGELVNGLDLERAKTFPFPIVIHDFMQSRGWF